MREWRMNTEFSERILEALLFVCSGPLTYQELLQFLEGLEESQVAAAAESLNLHYREAHSALSAIKVAGGWQLVTTPDLAERIAAFKKTQHRVRFSGPALETLAIVAYRQPISTPEIESIRGVSAAGVIKTLLERRMIRILGRKEVPGRPMIYGTTREFLEHFGLDSLRDLPRLEELVTDTEGASADGQPAPLAAVDGAETRSEQ
jgi:segregation and condensation protein B